MSVWEKKFPKEIRPAIRLFLESPADATWERAVKIVGKRNAMLLAKSLVGRTEPPYFDVNRFLVPAARLLRAEPEWLAKAAEDFLRQCANLRNARMGDGERLRELRKLIPSSALSAEAKALIRKLASNRSYAPIASSLRAWSGERSRTKATIPEPVTVKRLEVLVDAFLAAQTPAARRSIAAEILKIDWEDAADEDTGRLAAAVAKLEARMASARGATASLLREVVESLTST